MTIKYYPLNLALENKKCVVFGAGLVALRKARRLVECGARVSVIGQKITPGLKRLSEKKKIIFKKKRAGLKDLKGAFLVVAATDDRKLNALISAYCLKRNVLVNVVDSPKECNFILPAIAKRGDLTISISTAGISPALCKKIKQDLEKKFGIEYSRLLELIKKIRPAAIKEIKNINLRKTFFKKAFGPAVLRLLKKNRIKEARRELERQFKR